MNRPILLAATIFVALLLPADYGFSQSTTLTSSTNAPKQVRIEGLVVAQKKYSISVKTDQGEYQVKLANGAPIALKMNKPWFDWKNDQVVVDALPYPNDPTKEPKRRVGVKFPAEKLYLISRFPDKEQLDEVMSTPVKRINYYLITPTDPGSNFPNEKKLYISGELDIQDNKDVKLKVDRSALPVRLGFRFATMNGYSIMELTPWKTQVFLTGVVGERKREILATRLLFQPVVIE